MIALLLLLPGQAWALDRDGPQGAAARIVPGQVIVRFAADAAAAEREQVRRETGTEAIEGLGLPGLQLVRVTDADSVAATVRQLERNPAVRYAEADRLAHPALVPDDTLFGQLWGLEAIDAPEAWDLETGEPSTLIAVMDTGADLGHLDLQNQLWANPGETGGGFETDGIDNDGNGFIDDVNGFDFFDDDNDPGDLFGHGTHVSGTVLAEGNNAEGVTGVSWDGSMMSLRVCGAYADGCPISAIVDAIDYAGDNGARVMNGSIEGPVSQAEADALEAHPDTLFVFAAGNGGIDGVGDNNDASPVFPCAADQVSGYSADNVVCVAATDEVDDIAGFSNFGLDSVDLGAPGTEILSTSSVKDIFSDDFEVNDFAARWTNTIGPGWARSNESPLSSFGVTDSPGGNYAASTTNEVTSNAVALPAGYSTCELDYFRSINLAAGDNFRIEVLLDAPGPPAQFVVKAQSILFTSANNGAGDRFFELNPDFDPGGQVQVRLRIVSDATSQAAGIHMDDIRLFCHGSPSDNGYQLLSGTSMATPHVTGTAGLLFSQTPSLTVAQAKAALLDTVDLIPSLGGITVTGGRLNTFRALTGDTNLPPAPLPDEGGGGGSATPTDTTPPNTSFLKKPAKVVHTDDPRAKVVFKFGSSEAGSTFLCRLDGQAFHACNKRVRRRLAEGRHKLKAKAIDAAGNVDPTPAVRRFKVVSDG